MGRKKSPIKKALPSPDSKKIPGSSPTAKQISPRRENPGPSGDHSINNRSTDEPHSTSIFHYDPPSTEYEPPSTEYEPSSSESDDRLTTVSLTISERKEDEKSFTGLLKKLLDPTILCIFIAIVAFFTALPAKKAFYVSLLL